MNKIFNLIKKELDKIFRSPRTVISNFILPGLLIFIVYSIIGNIVSTNIDNVQSSEIKVAVVNLSNIFTTQFDAYNSALEQSGKDKLKFEFINEPTDIKDFTRIINYSSLTDATDSEKSFYDKVNNDIINKKYDLYICFNENFDSKLLEYQSGNINSKAIVGVFGKNTIQESAFASSTVNTILNMLQPKCILAGKVDFSSENDLSISILASLIPMFLIIFVFAGGMSVCADSIAGEKERGTLSTLLMTPIKRSNIIYGKIISLVVVTIVAAIGPFIAVIASLPNLIKGTGVNVNIAFDVLSAGAIAEIFVIVLVTSLLATSIFLLLSTISKTVKEATTLSSAVSTVVTVIALIATEINLGNSLGYYFVPFMNIALCLNGIVMGTITTGQILSTVFSSIGYCIFLIILAVKLFNSEKILYSK